MDRKQWLEDNKWFLDAIANETPVLFFDSENGEKEKMIPIGFSLEHSADLNFEAENREYFMYAKPIPTTDRRYKGPVEIMQWLVDHGYAVSHHGHWFKPGNINFLHTMWQYCGTPVWTNNCNWHPEWIEEVEIK